MDAPVLDVHVHNHARIRKDLLAAAVANAAGILRAAGVGTRWRDCSGAIPDATNASPCLQPPAASRLIVRILPRSKRAVRLVPGAGRKRIEITGEALCLRENEGTYVTIYARSVEKLARTSRSGMPLLLGHSFAHEIGHLLLGPQHTTGIMAPDYAMRNRPAGAGDRLFAESDARRLVERARARVTADGARDQARRGGR